MKKFIKSSYMAFILLIIYIPIAVLILFSFNSTSSLSHFYGFSFQWYANLLKETSFIHSILLSIILGVLSTFISIVIGTMATIGISKSSKLTRKMTLSVSNIPLINADIVTAVALMILFITLSIPFGFFTLLLAHISFNIPYVIMIVYPQIRKIDNRLIESSLDLGAKPSYTLFKIALPILKPTIIIAGLICFSMSFDDFIISYFTGGGSSNVGTYIYALKRTEPYINAFATIVIVLLLLSIISFNFFITFSNKKAKLISRIKTNDYNFTYFLEKKLVILKNKKQKNDLSGISDNKFNLKIAKIELKIKKANNKIDKIRSKIKNKEQKELKKYLHEQNSTHVFWIYFSRIWKRVTLTAIAIGAFTITTAFYIAGNQYDLIVANWGEYLPEDILKKFENETGIRVKYDQFDSNEDLFSKLYTYNKYDVMVPSTYMAEKMRQANDIQKIDYSKISGHNIQFGSSATDFYNKNVSKKLNDILQTKKISSTDDIRSYQVPYFWGDIRIVINPNNHSLVDWLASKHIDLSSGSENISKKINWNILKEASEAKYKVIINNDPKNIFLPDSQASLGKVEPTSTSEANQIINKVGWVDSNNVSLQGDEIVDSMSSGNFDIAVVYNGDALYSQLNRDPNNKNTKEPFVITYPNTDTEGTDIWSDGMVLNKHLTHESAAYKFISFIISNQEEIANDDDFIYYTSPYQYSQKWISDHKFKNNKSSYNPVPFADSKHNGMFWYNPSDKILLNKYSEILASKH